MVTLDGEPVQDVRVLAETRMARTQQAVSDAAGAFVIDGLAPGVYRLRAIGGIRILRRGDGATVALFENRYRLQRLLADEPELTLKPLNAE